MKIKCVSKFLCEVCGVRDSLQIFYNNKGEARYCRVRHRDASTKRFYYHQQSKAYADKHLESCRETLSQTQPSHSNKGLIDHGHSRGQNGQIESSTILESNRASSSVRIEHQPPKLGVEGSNPSPPAIVSPLFYKAVILLRTSISIDSQCGTRTCALHARTLDNTISGEQA